METEEEQEPVAISEFESHQEEDFPQRTVSTPPPSSQDTISIKKEAPVQPMPWNPSRHRGHASDAPSSGLAPKPIKKPSGSEKTSSKPVSEPKPSGLKHKSSTDPHRSTPKKISDLKTSRFRLQHRKCWRRNRQKCRKQLQSPVSMPQLTNRI